MRIVEVKGRAIRQPDALRVELIEKGYQVITVASQSGAHPSILVYLQDSERKDPTAIVTAFKDPGKLAVSSNKIIGVGGVPEAAANQTDVHTLTIVKQDMDGQPATGNEQIQVIPSQMMTTNPSKATLVNGQVQVKIGPSAMAGELLVKVMDISGKLRPAVIKLRFA